MTSYQYDGFKQAQGHFSMELIAKRGSDVTYDIPQ
jgi:hypothetical protein